MYKKMLLYKYKKEEYTLKTNITFICQIDSFSKKVAEKVSQKLDLYYADIDDFLAFNLTTSPEEIISTCGKEYLEKLEEDAVKTVASFENSIISAGIRFFMVANSRHALKDGSMVVYLKIGNNTFDKYIKSEKDESKRLSLQNQSSVFDEYDKMCLRSSDIILELKDLNEKAACKKSIKVINNYFK